MTKIEELELELAARKMVEGTSLEWVEVLRDNHTKACVGHALPGAADDYELTLGIIESKPVWRGDKLWNITTGKEYTITQKLDTPADWSWNPPKPKTGMTGCPCCLCAGGGEAD